MKKKLILFLTTLFLLAFSAVAFANYPSHLNGDRNLIMVDGHMGYAWYVDRNSVNVLKYAPPQYIIQVDVVSAVSAKGNSPEAVKDFYSGGDGKITGRKPYRFFYNTQLGQMYVDKNTGSNDWQYLPPDGPWCQCGVRMPAGEMAFALAYNYKFYGRRAFSNDFYERI